jgi:hypothetical protein
MNAATSRKVDLVMRELRARKQRGEIAEEAKVSTEQMARVSVEIGQPVSAITFRRIERAAIAKLTLAVFYALETHPELPELIGSDHSIESNRQ